MLDKNNRPRSGGTDMIFRLHAKQTLSLYCARCKRLSCELYIRWWFQEDHYTKSNDSCKSAARKKQIKAISDGRYIINPQSVDDLPGAKHQATVVSLPFIKNMLLIESVAANEDLFLNLYASLSLSNMRQVDQIYELSVIFKGLPPGNHSYIV